MKKFMRLIVDLVIAAGIVAAVIMGIVAVTGPLADWKSVPDQLMNTLPDGFDSIKNSNTYYWLALSGIIVAGLAAIPTAISIVFFFRKVDGWGWIIFSGILMLVAIVLTAIAAHHNGVLNGDAYKALWASKP